MSETDAFDAGGRRQKFFISYRRSANDDCSLASYLKAGLKKEGHDVFIDVGMTVGTDWAAEIAKRIEWCDHLVVLLSEDSIGSEMVQGEVRLAHQSKKDDGRPIILPIRVGYEGPLDYELDSYLGRLQYVRWSGADDSARVLSELLRAANGLQEAPATFETDAIALDPRRPQPVSDPRALRRPPGGAIRIDDPFYVARSADDIITAAAGSVGETIVIKAPRQMGKSSLLIRYLASCHDAAKQFVYLDFQSFTDAELDDYLTLLQRIAGQFLRSLKLEGPDVAEIESQLDFIHFIEDHVLSAAGGPVTFGFDEVDRLLGRSYQGNFFSMLRTWHNNRANPLSPWAEVDLALVIATEPYLLIETADQSPFNVSTPIELEPFEQSAVADLNERYGRLLKAAQLKELYELLAGHPYLTRLAFFRMVGQNLKFDELNKRAKQTDGPFGDHLRAMLMVLQQQPQLLAAFKQLISDRAEPDEDTYHRLHGAGLACRAGDRIAPANLLYARFFKQVR